MGELLDFSTHFQKRKEIREARFQQDELYRIYGFLEVGPGGDFCLYCEQMRGFDGRCKNEDCPAFVGPSGKGT